MIFRGRNCAKLSRKPVNWKYPNWNVSSARSPLWPILRLLGLLGTVAGMIEAFGVIASNGGYATVTELSGGIYKSLLTTAAGLVVATPTFVAYSYLSSRVNTLMHDMERAGIEIVQMLTETEPESGIISFRPSAESSPRDFRREK